MEALRKLRSALSLAVALSWFVPAAVVLHLVIVPASRLFPRLREPWGEWFVGGMARLLLATFRAGGARFEVRRTIPASAPCLIVGNHQSLIDPAVVIANSSPHIPAFAARTRYGPVPVVGESMRILGCPLVDPKRDPKGAVAVMAEGARTLPYGLLVYPEGHRTKDGEMRPWRTAGLTACLEARRLPVYLVVEDGLWHDRRLVDFLVNVHKMRGVVDVLGPFEPPADAAAIPAFIEELRQRIVGHLASLRSGDDERAA
jgi:1-acyl-sn-glycerol-3-phosphate acyltransferase